MNHLFFYLNGLRERMDGRGVSLFLDYDGTLAPIVKTPDKADIPRETRAALKSLSDNKYCRLAVISGRALKDVKRRIGLKGIAYAGNHGLEIEGPGVKFRIPVSLRYKITLKKIKALLKKRLSKIKGIIIEDKGLTLSVHYRLADKKDERLLKTIFYDTLNYYIIDNKIKVKPGKKVLEIRPPLEWNKGEIVMWLLARGRHLPQWKDNIPVYIGDDITDEDAFMALKDIGLTIFVGNPKSSNAEYYLKNTREVREFLEWILKIKTNGAICKNRPRP